MFKFVKIQINHLKYQNWYLLCDNLDVLSAWFAKYMNSEYIKVLEDVKKRQDVFINRGYVPHASNILTGIVENLSIFYDTDNPKEVSCHMLFGKTIVDRMNDIQAGRVLLLTDGMPYMVKTDNVKILNSITRDVLEFDYSESDIKIIQWPHGKHFYAKIGNLDVVDENGNVKWNSYKEAEGKAKQFLTTL